MTQNEPLLSNYLNKYPYHHETYETWPVQGKMRVRLSLSDSLPPAHVSSSILAIVINLKMQVLFLWPQQISGSIGHLLIGGRPEGSESPEQTAIREVAEETGWNISPLRLIGFRHFFQTEPCSPANNRPYPDFIQPVYAALALNFDRNILIPDDQLPAEFWELKAVEDVIDPPQRPLLHAAVAEIRSKAPCHKDRF